MDEEESENSPINSPILSPTLHECSLRFSSISPTYIMKSPTLVASSPTFSSNSPFSTPSPDYPDYTPPYSPPYSPPSPFSPSYDFIEDIERELNENASENRIESWFGTLARKGTGQQLNFFTKITKKYFPNYLTTNLLKELFEIAYANNNYEAIDYILSSDIFSVKEIDEQILERILRYSILMPCIIHRNSDFLRLLNYLEDKGVDIKNQISMGSILDLLYWSFHNSSSDYHFDRSPILISFSWEEKKQFEVVKYLLNNFVVDLNEVKMIHGESIMKFALQSRNLKLIKYFVSIEIDDIKKKFDGKNALYFTLYNWRDNDDKEQEKSIFKLVKYLVEKGVNIHECNERGVNSLHLSAQFHSLKMVKYFISLGVDLHSLDHQNSNALLYAFKLSDKHSLYERMEKRRIKIVKYLIMKGINVEQTNKPGMNALLYSIKWGNFEIIELIAELIPSLKTQLTITKNKYLLKDIIRYILKRFDIEMIKYLDQFPSFSNYFDGKNRIKTKNFILFDLLELYENRINFRSSNKIEFKIFKEIFNFFLNKKNNINNKDQFNRIPLQHLFTLFSSNITWKLLKYLIEKGSDLNQFLNDNLADKICYNEEYLKYFIIKSLEINYKNDQVEENDEEEDNYDYRRYNYEIRMENDNNFNYNKNSNNTNNNTNNNHNNNIHSNHYNIHNNNNNNIHNNNNNLNNNNINNTIRNEENDLPNRKVARINNKEVHDNDTQIEDIVSKWKREFIIVITPPDYNIFYNFQKEINERILNRQQKMSYENKFENYLIAFPSIPNSHSNIPIFPTSSPTYTPTSPSYHPISPTYTPISPSYHPTSPSYHPTSPLYFSTIFFDKDLIEEKLYEIKKYPEEIEQKFNELAEYIAKRGTDQQLEYLIKHSDFSHLNTVQRLKILFGLACKESNYNTMDLLLSLLDVKEIDEAFLTPILLFYVQYFVTRFEIILLKYLEEKVDMKNQISTKLISDLLYWCFYDCSDNLPLQVNNSIDEKKQFEVVKYLLNNFVVDLNEVKIIRGESIMKFALQSHNLKLIKYFVSIEMGIDDIKKFDGKNALYFTLQNNIWRENDKEQEKSIFKVVKYLVEKGVNIHECDENGVNSLHLSAQFHSLKMVKYFISLGVDLHSLDHQNNNALLYAFKPLDNYLDLERERRIIKNVKYLISEGINVEQRNDEGMDAFLYSIKCANFELIKFIADLIPSLKTQMKIAYKSYRLDEAMYKVFSKFDIEVIKYLDQFPSFSNYFDGKNKINPKKIYLYNLIFWLSRNFQEESEGDPPIQLCKDFKKFKEVFNFFLNKRNNINCLMFHFNHIPIHSAISLFNGNTPRKLLDYLIEKGSDLHYLLNNYHYDSTLQLKNLSSIKYIIIRSLEINYTVNTENKMENEKIIINYDENDLPIRKVARINNIEVHDNDLHKDIEIKWKREFISAVITPPNYNKLLRIV